MGFWSNKRGVTEGEAILAVSTLDKFFRTFLSDIHADGTQVPGGVEIYFMGLHAEPLIAVPSLAAALRYVLFTPLWEALDGRRVDIDTLLIIAKFLANGQFRSLTKDELKFVQKEHPSDYEEGALLELLNRLSEVSATHLPAVERVYHERRLESLQAQRRRLDEQILESQQVLALMDSDHAK